MVEVGVGTRNPALDIAKGIGILFVFVGHSVWEGGLTFGAIFNFHMPLFFFLSGMLFKPEKYASSHAMLKHVVVMFLMPYLFFNVFGLLTFCLSSRFPHDLHGVIACVYSLLVGCHPLSNGPTWFLIVLAEIQMATWFVLRVSNGRTLVLLLVASAIYVIGSIGWSSWLPSVSPRFIPFRFLSAMLAFLYFAFGYVFAKYYYSKTRLAWISWLGRDLKFFMVTVAVFMTFFLTQRFGGNSIVDYPWHPYLFILTSMLGIFVVLTVSHDIICIDKKCGGPISYIGRNSLYYFASEMVVGVVIWRIMTFFHPHLSWPFYTCRCYQGIAILYCVLNLLVVSAVFPVVKLCYNRVRGRFQCQH